MKLLFASDHAGFALKRTLMDDQTAKGVDVVDLGPETAERVDYPTLVPNLRKRCEATPMHAVFWFVVAVLESALLQIGLPMCARQIVAM